MVEIKNIKQKLSGRLYLLNKNIFKLINDLCQLQHLICKLFRVKPFINNKNADLIILADKTCIHIVSLSSSLPLESIP